MLTSDLKENPHVKEVCGNILLKNIEQLRTDNILAMIDYKSFTGRHNTGFPKPLDIEFNEQNLYGMAKDYIITDLVESYLTAFITSSEQFERYFVDIKRGILSQLIDDGLITKEAYKFALDNVNDSDYTEAKIINHGRYGLHGYYVESHIQLYNVTTHKDKAVNFLQEYNRLKSIGNVAAVKGIKDRFKVIADIIHKHSDYINTNDLF